VPQTRPQPPTTQKSFEPFFRFEALNKTACKIIKKTQALFGLLFSNPPIFQSNLSLSLPLYPTS
jgi:hypothetical protein